MDRYMVTVPHAADVVGCTGVVKIFLETGSHYLANADWGCEDGVHKAWLIVEAADREEARWIVPAPLRADARVVRLTKFSRDEIDATLRHHGE